MVDYLNYTLSLDVVMKDFGNQKAEVTTVEEDAE